MLSGSFGTLGPLTEICLKIWPRPPAQRTLLVHELDAAQASAQLVTWASLPLQITGLAHLPAGVGEAAGTAARLEGPTRDRVGEGPTRGGVGDLGGSQRKQPWGASLGASGRLAVGGQSWP